MGHAANGFYARFFERLISTGLLGLCLFTLSVESYAAPERHSRASSRGHVIQGDLPPFGNPNAPQGGTFNYNLTAEPATLHPVLMSDLFGFEVKRYVCNTLMVRHPDTYEWVPGLAERAEISPDGTQFTFRIRKGATFHDGHPLTAEDVKFSFDMIFDPKQGAAHMQSYYENIEKAEIVDPLTVRFKAKSRYFRNFEDLADLDIFPKHVYEDPEKSRKLTKTLICSGPYKIESYDQGQSLTVVRFKDFWGNHVSHLRGAFNFERIRFRFVKEIDVALELLKKGDVDFQGLENTFSAEAYSKKAVGPEWGTKVFKVKVENLSPKPYGYLGWNLQRPLFADRNVRQGLYHALNRAEINKKFRYEMSLLATGPWYQQSEYADPSVKPVEFDLVKAAALFKKAGWADSDKDGVLDKVIDGKKTDFRFSLFHSNKDNEKYWILYQSDLKKIGVDLQIQMLEWPALVRAANERKFDVVAMSWGAGNVMLDPKQIWHSSSAAAGGSNRVGYSNGEVDRLLDKARFELDKKKRIEILRDVYRRIAADAPYAFLFNDRYVLYAHSAKVKRPKDTYRYTVAPWLWWAETPTKTAAGSDSGS